VIRRSPLPLFMPEDFSFIGTIGEDDEVQTINFRADGAIRGSK
jgi:hypothetical protein